MRARACNAFLNRLCDRVRVKSGFQFNSQRNENIKEIEKYFVLLNKTVIVFLAAGGAAAAASISTESGCHMPAYYLVKWITWKEKKTPIITQSENGPCPLLAIMNTLFLRWKVGPEPR